MGCIAIMEEMNRLKLKMSNEDYDKKCDVHYCEKVAEFMRRPEYFLWIFKKDVSGGKYCLKHTKEAGKKNWLNLPMSKFMKIEVCGGKK